MAKSELSSDGSDPAGLHETVDRYLEILIGHSLEEVLQASGRLPSEELRNVLDNPALFADARYRVAQLIGIQLNTEQAEEIRDGLDDRLRVIGTHEENIPHLDVDVSDAVGSVERCTIMHDAIKALRDILSGDRFS